MTHTPNVTQHDADSDVPDVLIDEPPTTAAKPRPCTRCNKTEIHGATFQTDKAGVRRMRCEDCNAACRAKRASTCAHGRRKGNCEDCHLANVSVGVFNHYCPHGRRQARCNQCQGKSICPCGRQKSTCRKCDRPSWLLSRCSKRAQQALGNLPCSTLKLLDVASPEALLAHIEHLMVAAEPPLLWDNYASAGAGGWQLDHIEALKSPVTDADGAQRPPSFAEIAARCRYTNLRPLDTVEHLEKSLAETLVIRDVRAAVS